MLVSILYIFCCVIFLCNKKKKAILPTVHCMIIVDTVIGNSFIDAKHQETRDFTVCLLILYLGTKHFAKDTNLVAPIKIYSLIHNFNKM